MTQPVTIRASSLPELFDCPARWEAKHIRGLYLPTSGAAQLGTAVHAATAAFDHATLNGSPITADDAAGAAVDAIHKPEREVDWEELKPNVAEKIALNLNRTYCEQVAPLQSYLGIEVTCEKLLIADLGIELTGTTDRVRVSEDGAVGIADIKTGAQAVSAQGVVKTSGHTSQLAVYELLASQALGQPMTAPARVIGMQTGKTAKAQRVATADVENPSAILIADDYSPGLLTIASQMVYSGLFYGNPRSYLCSAKYCPIHHICKFKG